MKHVYRLGLGLRYGRMMQAISGVHFNYSFPDRLWPVIEAVNESKLRGQALIDDAYFALLRNYRRYGWLILFLFGVSPGGLPLVLRRPRRSRGPRAGRERHAHRAATRRRCA